MPECCVTVHKSMKKILNRMLFVCGTTMKPVGFLTCNRLRCFFFEHLGSPGEHVLAFEEQ